MAPSVSPVGKCDMTQMTMNTDLGSAKTIWILLPPGRVLSWVRLQVNDEARNTVGHEIR